MNIEEVRLFALSLPGATEDMPYGPDWVTFRIEGKIFLHIPVKAPIPTIALKLTPEHGFELREHYSGIRAAYHLNKVHWNDVQIEAFPSDFVKELITESYLLVLSKLPKLKKEKSRMV